MRFARLQHPGVQGGVDGMLAGSRFDLAAFQRGMQFFLQRMAGAEQVVGMLQGTDRIFRRLRAIAAGQQLFKGRVAFGATDHRGHFGVQCIRRPGMTTPEREHDDPQQAAEHLVREVAEQFIQRALRLAEAFFHGPGEQRFQMVG